MVELLQFFSDASNLTPICNTGSCGLPTPGATNDTVTTIFQLLLNILGAVGLLIIVIAGLRYTTAGGDSNKAAQARTTIAYTLAGLIIVISAKLIITFVIKRVS